MPFTAPEVCQCQPCHYVSRQFFLEPFLPILARKGMCLFNSLNTLLGARAGILVPELQLKTHCIHPINTAFSKGMFGRQTECELDLPAPFPVFFPVPQPLTHHLLSSSPHPFLLGDKISLLVARQPVQICRVSRILASALFSTTHSSHHLTDQIIYRSQPCGSIMGSFIQPTQHNTFLPDVLRNGTPASSWMENILQDLLG